MAYDQMTLADVASGHTITLNPVLDVDWGEYDRLYRTVNGTVRKKDVPYDGPTEVTLRLCVVSCTATEQITMHDWWLTGARLTLTDLAYAGGGTPATDSYVHTYDCILKSISAHAIQKGRWDDWTITLLVDGITTI
ncbi:MAG: hypothetical protein WC962_08355 [Phycisphaerae bacterium]|jgi:hypothetical protein